MNLILIYAITLTRQRERSLIFRLATRLGNVTKLHCGNAAATRLSKRSGETTRFAMELKIFFLLVSWALTRARLATM